MCMFTVKQTFGRFDSYVPTSDQKSSLFELQLTIQFFSWVFPLLSAFTATCGCLGLNIQPPNVQETHTCVIVHLEAIGLVLTTGGDHFPIEG